MGMKELFAGVAKVAFAVAGNVKVPCLYTSISDDGIHAPVTTVADVEIIYVELPSGFSSVAGGVNDYQHGDYKGLVIAPSLPVVPKRGDTVHDKATGKLSNVVAHKLDPAGATYELHLRTL